MEVKVIVLKIVYCNWNFRITCTKNTFISINLCTCSYVIFNFCFIPVRYSMTAAMYTGEPTPIRKRWVPIFKYRCIRPTGNVTLALCDLDIAFWRFFPPLADMFAYVFVSKFIINTAPTQNNINITILQYHWMAGQKINYITLQRLTYNVYIVHKQMPLTSSLFKVHAIIYFTVPFYFHTRSICLCCCRVHHATFQPVFNSLRLEVTFIS